MKILLAFILLLPWVVMLVCGLLLVYAFNYLSVALEWAHTNLDKLSLVIVDFLDASCKFMKALCK